MPGQSRAKAANNIGDVESRQSTAKEAKMTLKQLRTVALAATFLAGSAALGHAQSSSTIGAEW